MTVADEDYVNDDTTDISLDSYATPNRSRTATVDANDLLWLVDQVSMGFVVDSDAPTFQRLRKAV